MNMDKEHISEQMPDYLDGKLQGPAREAVRAHLEECGQCQKELEQLRVLFGLMDQVEIPVPSQRLEARFGAALEQGKRDVGRVGTARTTRTLPLLKLVAGIALLFGAFQLGSLSQAQKKEEKITLLQEQGLEMKQAAMLSLMENRSASKRIQGVGYIEAFPRPDPQILQALGERLLNDENDNVRMAAFEALAGFSGQEAVKELMLQALGRERNPGLQVAIIKLLAQIQEKKAIRPMRELLEREDIQPFIKEEIKALWPSIT